MEVEEEGDVQLSNRGVRWRVEGVTEVHASGTQFKSGRDYWMEMVQVWTSLRVCQSLSIRFLVLV